MEGEIDLVAENINATTTLRDAAPGPDCTTPGGGGDVLAIPGTQFVDLPPPYEEPVPTVPSVRRRRYHAGQDRDRAAVYSFLYEESSSTTSNCNPQGAANHVSLQTHSDSNGWYDGCFSRSCVCDYTGRHVIPEYITSGSLYSGRVLGWRIFRKMVLPLIGDVFRIIWVVAQWVMSISLLSLSSVNYASGRHGIYNIVHLSLSALALLLATVDLGGFVIYKIKKCSSNTSRYARLNDDDEALADDIDGTTTVNSSDPHSAKGWARFTNVDIARLIIPELLLFPIVICDVYMLISDNVFKLSSTLDWTGSIEFLFSVSAFVIQVYIIRLALLAMMTYRVHAERSLPTELCHTQEAMVGAGYDPKVRRNGLIYLSFLIFNAVTHMINQIAMVIAIGVKIHNYTTVTPTPEPTPCVYYWDCNHDDGDNHNSVIDASNMPFYFWFMIVAGYLLPIVGAWLFFSVTHFWLQEFAIGITIDYLSILKLPGADGIFFPDCNPYEAQDKINMILIYNKYDTLRQDYHALQNESLLAKAWYPFKSLSHVLMCLAYTTVQIIFVYVAAFSIQGNQLNMAVFLLVIVTELLANAYTVAVALFWVMVAVGFLMAIGLALAVGVKCMICIALFCSSVFDSYNRGPPQPPVMTPQIRMGLQQV